MNAIKAGARHSASDQERIQTAHDALVSAGALCSGAMKAVRLPIKATPAGHVSGYLVRFGGPDVEGDSFLKSTDFGLKDGQQLPLLFHHGLDKDMGATPIGQGTVRRDAAGWWLEGWLSKRAKYLALIMKMAADGLLGFSSGADPDSVVRVPIPGKAHQYAIKTWHIREASLTPLPAAGPWATLASAKAMLDPRAQRIKLRHDALEHERALDLWEDLYDLEWGMRLERELDEFERGI